MTDIGLLPVAVTFALGVGGVRCPHGVVIFQPTVRSVVDGQTQDRHIVGVHYPVHEANSHPVRNHHRCATADFQEPLPAFFLRIALQFGVIAGDGEIHQLFQQTDVATRGRQFKVAKAGERGRNPAHDCPRFNLRVAIVKHIA